MPCGHAMNETPLHCFFCARKQVMARHHALRDCWRDLCDKAGWPTQLEQFVACRDRPVRADLVASDPVSGRTYACDVRAVTVASGFQPALDRAELDKCATYQLSAGSYDLPGGE
eukprot:4919637-Amphidinium_carterae.1